ncbi:hypothetical protein KY285_021196 [Solanum tuberosum]|nr:hypothetical protein KY284_021253 [Solanum tuberosum]KAH0694099.1 hypothetical protein KY285_021196 [Solanum tuberosum]
MVDQQVDPIPSGSTSTVRIEIPSPFYLHPSENAGSSLLPGVFDGTGYRSWRRAVLRDLSVKSKTCFNNGKLVKPNPDDASFQQWERCDDMVTSWILNSLSPDLRDSLQYVNNAHELWAELEERYDQTNGCKLYQLQNEINDLVQGTLDVNGYYTKMKKLWEEMSIVDEEKQREVRPHNHTTLDSTSLNALANSTRPKGGPRTNCSSSKGNTRVSGNLNNVNVFRGNSSTSRSSLFCDFCRRTGHTRERCYKLHGYPSNSKFSKGKSVGSAANMCTSENDRNQCEEDPELRKQMPLNLSKDQYEQLLNLLGSLQVGHVTTNSYNMLSGAVNLASILVCYSSITEICDCRCVKLTADSWIIDSGVLTPNFNPPR